VPFASWFWDACAFGKRFLDLGAGAARKHLNNGDTVTVRYLG
jgi:hypothetical protein